MIGQSSPSRASSCTSRAHHLRRRAHHHQQRDGDATLQRVKEIGTMRAIGAERRFVLIMLLIETRGGENVTSSQQVLRQHDTQHRAMNSSSSRRSAPSNPRREVIARVQHHQHADHRISIANSSEKPSSRNDALRPRAGIHGQDGRRWRRRAPRRPGQHDGERRDHQRPAVRAGSMPNARLRAAGSQRPGAEGG